MDVRFFNSLAIMEPTKYIEFFSNQMTRATHMGVTRWSIVFFSSWLATLVGIHRKTRSGEMPWDKKFNTSLES